MKAHLKAHVGLYILRLGLAVVFLWFGASQLVNAPAWTTWIPDWATSLTSLDALTLVYINGALEVIGGVLLATNTYTRIVSLLLGLHLLVITLEIGLSATGIRDFGLTAATFALAFLSSQNNHSTTETKKTDEETQHTPTL